MKAPGDLAPEGHVAALCSHQQQALATAGVQLPLLSSCLHLPKEEGGLKVLKASSPLKGVFNVLLYQFLLGCTETPPAAAFSSASS